MRPIKWFIIECTVLQVYGLQHLAINNQQRTLQNSMTALWPSGSCHVGHYRLLFSFCVLLLINNWVGSPPNWEQEKHMFKICSEKYRTSHLEISIFCHLPENRGAKLFIWNKLFSMQWWEIFKKMWLYVYIAYVFIFFWIRCFSD